MTKLHVTFYKEASHGLNERTLERIEFYYTTSSETAFFDAYDEAVKRGHDPQKHIQIVTE